MIGMVSGTVGNWRKTRYHSDYNIIEIGQNTKSLGDLKDLLPFRLHEYSLPPVSAGFKNHKEYFFKFSNANFANASLKNNNNICFKH